MAEKKYQQIYEAMQSLILSGQLKPGELLPSENELANMFHTSRGTVRKSLSMLESKRIIHPHHGKGYFIDPPEHQRFTLIYDEPVTHANCVIRGIMLEHPNPETQKVLIRSADEWVVYILRTVHHQERTAMVCEQVYIPYRKGMPLVEEEIQYAEFSDLAKPKHSVFLHSTQMEIGVEAIDEKISEYLGLKPGTNVLVVYRYLINDDGQVAVYSKQFRHPSYGRIAAYSGADAAFCMRRQEKCTDEKPE